MHKEKFLGCVRFVLNLSLIDGPLFLFLILLLYLVCACSTCSILTSQVFDSSCYFFFQMCGVFLLIFCFQTEMLCLPKPQ